MECFISLEEKTAKGLISLMVVRKMPSGKYCLGIYLVDKYFLGLKSTTYRFAIEKQEIEEIAEEMFAQYGGCKPTTNEYAHNLIYGGIDYAEELGFKPDKDWALTQYFLNPDYITEAIDEIEFGRGGVPYYFAGPYDNVNHILNTLRKNVGEDNFHYVATTDF